MNRNDTGGRKALDTADANRSSEQLRTDGGESNADLSAGDSARAEPVVGPAAGGAMHKVIHGTVEQIDQDHDHPYTDEPIVIVGPDGDDEDLVPVRRSNVVRVETDGGAQTSVVCVGTDGGTPTAVETPEEFLEWAYSINNEDCIVVENDLEAPTGVVVWVASTIRIPEGVRVSRQYRAEGTAPAVRDHDVEGWWKYELELIDESDPDPAVALPEGYMPSAVAEKLVDVIHGAEAGLTDDEVQAISAAESLLDELGRSEARFEIYERHAGVLYWRMRGSGGEVIAHSGESYSSKQKVKEGIASLVTNAVGADVIEFDPDDGEGA